MFNVTLGVQACHFLITYWFLARFFFKPVLQQLNIESQERERLVRLIDKSRSLLRQGQIDQRRLWHDFHEQFRHQMAFCANLKTRSVPKDAGIVDLPVIVDPSAEQVRSVADRLMQKINYGGR